jgi:hypothetical protein
MNKQRVAMILMIILLMVLALMACEAPTPPPSGILFTYPTLAPSPMPGYDQDPAYAVAQATLAAGQNAIMDLSHQATVVSMNMEQAANAAAQSTVDYNQRQLLELSIQGTEISQNIARAAATQQFIAEQTQMVLNATGTAQSQVTTATYSAYILNVTQTAQAQAVLDVQATHAAQANATFTAYSLTATPWAAIQSEIVRTRNEANRRALWGEFVVTPLKVILATLVVVLLIVGGVMAYRRLMPVLELSLRTFISHDNDSPLLVDGTFVDAALPNRQLPSDQGVQIEIIDSSEPSITNWITEAEEKLRFYGEIQP